MVTSPAALKDRRKAPRRTPAWHFVRPLIVIGAAFLLYGVPTKSLWLTIFGIVLEGFAVLIAIVLHMCYCRRREQEKGIVCG